MANKTTQIPKRQLVADAILAATEGRWDDALAINDTILERFQDDAEALNRKGRALIERNELPLARTAYLDALKYDPANMIARRNLQRLEMLYSRGDDPTRAGDAPGSPSLPRSSAFIEEIGKTWVDEIANPADLPTLAEVSPGDQLTLEVDDGKVNVLAADGTVLGSVGAPVGDRMALLIAGGNRYEAYALGISSHSLRIIIREVFRHPSLATEISFKGQVRKTQDLMRERELLSLRKEGDFVFSDDDDIEDDEADAPEEDTDEEEVDPEASAYVDDDIAISDDDGSDPM